MRWQKNQAGGIAIIAVQKSSFSCSFYVDLGLKLDLTLPTHYRDVVVPLEYLVPDQNEFREISHFVEDASIDDFVDDASFDEECVKHRVRVISELLIGYGLPWLDRLDSPDSIRQIYESNGFSRWVMITLYAKRAVGITELD